MVFSAQIVCHGSTKSNWRGVCSGAGPGGKCWGRTLVNTTRSQRRRVTDITHADFTKFATQKEGHKNNKWPVHQPTSRLSCYWTGLPILCIPPPVLKGHSKEMGPWR